jgi:hypothetical protein
MRKALVAGVVGLGLLVGCTTAEERASMQAQERAVALAAFRLTCSEYGFKDNTQEMAQCIQKLDRETIKRKKETAEYWMRQGQAMSCRSSGHSFNELTGECTPPPQQEARSGTIFDNNNNRIGTISY